MDPLKRLFRTLDPRAAKGDSPSGDAAPMKSLRRDMATARRAIEALSTQVAALQRQAEQLEALRHAELDAPAQMERLEGVLRLSLVSGHVQAAVAASRLMQHPVPHIVVENLLPPELFAAVVEAIPPEAFFDDARERAQELRVPPPLAAVPVTVTWQFIATLMSDVVRPAIAARCASWLGALPEGLETTAGRLIRIDVGHDQPVTRHGPRDVATIVMYLAPAVTQREAPGSVVRAPNGSPVPVPFAPNTTLCVVGGAGTHEYGVLESGTEDAARYLYECRLASAADRS